MKFLDITVSKIERQKPTYIRVQNSYLCFHQIASIIKLLVFNSLPNKQDDNDFSSLLLKKK